MHPYNKYYKYGAYSLSLFKSKYCTVVLPSDSTTEENWSKIRFCFCYSQKELQKLLIFCCPPDYSICWTTFTFMHLEYAFVEIFKCIFNIKYNFCIIIISTHDLALVSSMLFQLSYTNTSNTHQKCFWLMSYNHPPRIVKWLILNIYAYATCFSCMASASQSRVTGPNVNAPAKTGE